VKHVKLALIIPVYNEGDNIGATLADIHRKVLTPHRIYIIYDFDEDNTLPAVKQYIESGTDAGGRTLMDIVLLKNPVRGVVNAIKCGLKSAAEEFLLVTMADLSDDYSTVDIMCEAMEQGCDVVCGSRYMKGGRQIGGPLIKKTISRIAGLSLHFLARLPTHDPTNSFKLYRKSFLDTIQIESDGGFEIGLEIVVKAHCLGRKICEVPTVWQDREKGESRFKILKWAPKYLKWYMLALGNVGKNPRSTR
jgi:glycosyltransferase involved in cell wall biosynthesis